MRLSAPALPPEEIVYSRAPAGFELLCQWLGWKDYKEGMLLKWVKAVYGLKRAMQHWDNKLKITLNVLGFDGHESEPCLLILRVRKVFPSN